MKTIIRIFGILLVIYLACCILGPKSFNTEQSVVIQAPPAKVYALISDFNEWNKWSPWFKRDPQMKQTLEGEAGKVGHKHSWVSESQGDGSQEIVAVKPDAYVKTELRFKDWDDPSYAEMMITPTANGSELKWNMKGSDFPFIFRGMMMVMDVPAKLEQDYREGLAGIKSLAEQNN